MTSERKKQANRSNSRSSTGPRDTSKTRSNALKHGISSQQAVVPQVDGADAAKRYDELRAGLWHDLAPQGILEAALVDQMAVALQQQRKLITFDNAVIQGQVEAEIKFWNERSQVDQTAIELMEAALTRLGEPGNLNDTADLTYLADFMLEQWGVRVEFALGKAIRTKRDADREISSYSPEQVQSLITYACRQVNISEHDLRTQLMGHLGEEIHRRKKELERNANQLELRRGLASLPKDSELNRILKYQSRIDRGLYKSLHELQRLQAGRQTGNPSIPAAVDVTVNVDTSLTPDGSELDIGDFPRGLATAEDGAVIVQGRIAGDEPGGQRGAAEIRQLSEAPSDSQSTAADSPEARTSCQSSTREEDARTADHEPERPQRSRTVPHELKTPKPKGQKLKDYLGEEGMARLLARRDRRGASEDDSWESPPARDSHELMIRQNEANSSGTASAAD